MKGFASFFVVFTVIITAIIFSFFFFRKPIDAQAAELFTLYFDIDPARQESAKIFAEILHNKINPSKVGSEAKVGEKPLAHSTAELVQTLKENRIKVKNALTRADLKAFSNPDVSNLHLGIKKYYQNLGEFEDFVVSGLDGVDTDLEYKNLIDTVFETSNRWQDILEADKALRKSLFGLAESYNLNFEGDTYAELFQKRLVAMDEPVLSKDFAVIEDSFVIEDPILFQTTLSFSFSNNIVDKTKIELIHPSGKVINFASSDIGTQVKLENEGKSFRNEISNNTVILKLLPQDPEIAPIKGIWRYKVTAPVGSKFTFGVVHL